MNEHSYLFVVGTRESLDLEINVAYFDQMTTRSQLGVTITIICSPVVILWCTKSIHIQIK